MPHDVPTSTPVALDPSDAAFLLDPHRIYDALRTESPVVRDPIGWSTIDHATSIEAFMDRSLTPGIDPLLESRGIEALWGEPGRTLTDSEGDDHRRLRRAVGPWFSPKRIGTLRDDTARLTHELLDLAEPDAPFDVMSGLADIVPARLFCRMVGAPDADATHLARLSKTILTVFTATDAMVDPVRAAKAEMFEYTRELIDARRADPGDDIVSALLAAEATGDVDETDVFHLVEELLSASVDNTANTVGLAVWCLLADAEDWRVLAREPDRVERATEECGRFEPAIRHTIKFALDDTEVGGVPVAAGEFVTIRVAAAHRDPAVYDDPHRFDIDRDPPRPQLTFGSGRHHCLGSALGRVEVNEMVRALTGRWPDAALGDRVEMSKNEAGLVHRLEIDPDPRP